MLKEFGLSQVGINREDFLQPDQVIQFGRKPYRIDLLTSIEGVAWDEAWEQKTEMTVGPHKCWALGINQLIKNKRTAGRPQDLADAARLEAGQSRRPTS